MYAIFSSSIVAGGQHQRPRDLIGLYRSLKSWLEKVTFVLVDSVEDVNGNQFIDENTLFQEHLEDVEYDEHPIPGLDPAHFEDHGQGYMNYTRGEQCMHRCNAKNMRRGQQSHWRQRTTSYDAATDYSNWKSRPVIAEEDVQKWWEGIRTNLVSCSLLVAGMALAMKR